MLNGLIRNKSFKIRHKILEVLYKEKTKNKSDEERYVGSIQISLESGISISEIHDWLYPLAEKNEIVYSNNDGQYMLAIQETGISTYVSKKYLRDGIKDRLDFIFDWARIIIPLGALALSNVNYIYNNNLSSKLRNLEEKVYQKK